MNGLRITAFVAALSFLVAATSFAADLTLAAGVFRFQATDYYYPNFFTNVGLRGELEYAPSAGRPHLFRLSAKGYPTDDNVFAPAGEYAYRLRLERGGWSFYAEPTVGFELTKLQYPRPYWPEIEWHFLPWLRAGGYVGVGRPLLGPLSWRLGYDARALYYAGSWHYKFKEERLKYVHAPELALRWRASERWTWLARVGWEFGGYYEDIFLTPEDLDATKPYGDVGVTYNF